MRVKRIRNFDEFKDKTEILRRFFSFQRRKGIQFPVKPGLEWHCLNFFFLNPTEKATFVPHPPSAP